MHNQEQLYRAIFDADGHLAPSGDGGYLGAVLHNENNKLLGQARLFPVDREDALQSKAVWVAAGIAIGVVGTLVAINAPHIKKWWTQVAQVKLRAFWHSVIRSQQVEEFSAAHAIVTTMSHEDISAEITATLNDNRVLMSNKEAQQRYLTMMLAVAFASEQMRILGNVRIADPAKLQELTNAANELSTKKAIAQANQILESDSAILDDESRFIFSEIFGGGVRSEQGYQPIERKRVLEALTLNSVTDSKSA